METHASLFKKSRDEEAFRQAAIEVQALSDQAASGEIELAYLDEAGFAAVHPNRSAWTECGKCHLVEAKRGKRLNVLAAFLSSGKVLSAKYWENTTADVFVGFLHWIKQQVDKPLTVILDNASIHKAKSITPLTAWLAKHGVTLSRCHAVFFPACSPELNRIEWLWHKIKYTWMAVKCRTAKELEADVGEILDNFGTTYKFDFYSR